MAQQQITFEAWRHAVDMRVKVNVGLGLDDLKGVPLADWYEQGMRPCIAAASAIKNAPSPSSRYRPPHTYRNPMKALKTSVAALAMVASLAGNAQAQSPSYTVLGPNGTTWMQRDGSGGFTAIGPDGTTFLNPH
jgi:hypothetical protein